MPEAVFFIYYLTNFMANAVQFYSTLYETVEGNELKIKVILDEAVKVAPEGIKIKLSSSRFFTTNVTGSADDVEETSADVIFEDDSNEGHAFIKTTIGENDEGVNGIEAVFFYIYIPKSLRNEGFEKGKDDRVLIVIREAIASEHVQETTVVQETVLPTEDSIPITAGISDALLVAQDVRPTIPDGAIVFADGTIVYASEEPNKYHPSMTMVMWDLPAFTHGSLIAESLVYSDETDRIYGYASTTNLQSLTFYKCASDRIWAAIPEQEFLDNGGKIYQDIQSVTRSNNRDGNKHS